MYTPLPTEWIVTAPPTTAGCWDTHLFCELVEVLCVLPRKLEHQIVHNCQEPSHSKETSVGTSPTAVGEDRGGGGERRGGGGEERGMGKRGEGGGEERRGGWGGEERGGEDM